MTHVFRAVPCALALAAGCSIGAPVPEPGAPPQDAGDVVFDAIDVDGDGQPRGVDCNDLDASVHPGALEIGCNGVDDDCDGDVDEGFEDRVTSIFYDDGGTGTVDWLTEQRWRADGQIVLGTLGHPWAADPIWITHYRYDRDGVLVGYLETEDGAPSRREAYGRDPAGRIDRWVTWLDGHSRPAEIREVDWTTAGLERAMRFDRNGDGTWDSIWEREYDALGNVIADRYDNGADGYWDRQEVTERLADGREVLFRVDYNPAPGWETVHSTTYDADGHLLRRDEDNSGAPDVRIHFATDDRGRVVLEEHDIDVDETIDRAFYYEHDEDGRVVGDGIDYDGDGTWDDVGTYSYDADGRPLSTSYVGDTWASLQTWTWDGDLLVEHTTVRTELDGTTTSAEEWDYDEAGREIEYRTFADEELTFRMVQLWGCDDA